MQIQGLTLKLSEDWLRRLRDMSRHDAHANALIQLQRLQIQRVLRGSHEDVWDKHRHASTDASKFAQTQPC